MAQMLLPNPRQRSVTAVAGIGDQHDGWVYSAALLQHLGAPSPLKLFSVQQGQAIVVAKGAAITASANTWQTIYGLPTTNLDRPSQLGDNLGDASVRGIGVTIETAGTTLTTGAQRAWGASQFELTDILSKCAGEFKIGGKPQIQGPIWSFPQLGGPSGSISSTGNAQTQSIASNGALNIGKEFRTPMMLGRYDSLLFELSTANGTTLAFSNTGTDGQPTLLWCILDVDFLSDVR
jgi:hypothetical protein